MSEIRLLTMSPPCRVKCGAIAHVQVVERHEPEVGHADSEVPLYPASRESAVSAWPWAFNVEPLSWTLSVPLKVMLAQVKRASCQNGNASRHVPRCHGRAGRASFENEGPDTATLLLSVVAPLDM